MAPTYGKLEALIWPPLLWQTSIGSLTESVGGGAAAVPLSADSCYWTTAGGGTTMLARLKASLEAASVNGLTYSVTLGSGENGNGILVISVSAGTFDLAWANDFETLAGFSGNIAAVVSATGDEHVKSLWQPCGAQIPSRPAGDPGEPETDARAMTSAGGHQATLYGFRRTVQNVMWEGLSQARSLIIGEALPNESFEQYWRDAILGEVAWHYPGNTCHFHWDADSTTVYATYRPQGNALVGCPVVRFQDRFDGIWTVTLDRLMEVPA